MSADYRSVAGLLAAAQRGLQQSVRPELQSDHARAQLAAVLDILSKLERMADWAPVIVREEDEALLQGIAAFEHEAHGAGLILPTTAPDATSAARMRTLTDWLYASVPAGAQRAALDTVLHGALRQAVAAERRHVPRTDFSAMTESKET